MTELISKAEDGDWRAVKKLLAAGADPNLSDSQGFTAIDHAAYHGHLEVVSTLLADTEPRFRRNSLLSGGIHSCLHLASQEGHPEVVKALVKAGGEALLNRIDANGGSCLYIASQNGHVEVVRVLVEAGGEALLGRISAKWGSCLHVASQKGNLELVRVLVRAGGEALLNKTEAKGFTCLHAASLKGRLEVVRMLVQFGGRTLLNRKGPDGITCLHVASAEGHLPVVQYLAGLLGGRLLHQVSGSRTALDWAMAGGHTGVRDWLLAAGARSGSSAARRRA
jgi:uncharacterized protein